jgi:hypothetical protein
MEVSIWWVVVASFLGVWTGFMLCAMLTIASESDQDERPLAPGANAHTLI